MEDITRFDSPRLDVGDLRVVLALASAGSTAKAAKTLHLTQPAVSRALLAIEGKLEARLFERTPRGLIPTSAGTRLVASAAPLLAELHDLEARVRAPSPARARLRLVCECYTAYHWLPSALTTLRKGLPGIELQLAVEHTSDPVAALEAGEIDAALVTTAQVRAGVLAERELFSDEVVFVVSSAHPLAARKTLTRADLRTHTLLTSPVPQAEAEWFVRRVFGRRPPRLRFERYPLTEPILELARAGMGIAVLSEWIATPHMSQGGLVAKRLASGPLYRPWRFVWRRDAEPAALRLFAAIAATVPRHLLPG